MKGIPMTQLTTEKITYSKTHLVISDEISFEEWQQAVETFARLGDCWQWWLGDLLAFGETKWGEMYAQALDSTEMKYQTLRNLKWVSGRFDPHRRREGVSWSHHAEIAAIDNKKKQNDLLRLCQSKGLSRKKLREHLAKDTEGMLGNCPAGGTISHNGGEVAKNGKNNDTEELFPASVENSTDGEDDSDPVSNDALTIDLSDKATKRNYDKMIKALDDFMRLRIPNMFLRGTPIENMVIELREALLEAGK